jgi:hypothetical protein
MATLRRNVACLDTATKRREPILAPVPWKDRDPQLYRDRSPQSRHRAEWTHRNKRGRVPEPGRKPYWIPANGKLESTMSHDSHQQVTNRLLKVAFDFRLQSHQQGTQVFTGQADALQAPMVFQPSEHVSLQALRASSTRTCLASCEWQLRFSFATNYFFRVLLNVSPSCAALFLPVGRTIPVAWPLF